MSAPGLAAPSRPRHFAHVDGKLQSPCAGRMVRLCADCQSSLNSCGRCSIVVPHWYEYRFHSACGRAGAGRQRAVSMLAERQRARPVRPRLLREPALVVLRVDLEHVAPVARELRAVPRGVEAGEDLVVARALVGGVLDDRVAVHKVKGELWREEGHAAARQRVQRLAGSDAPRGVGGGRAERGAPAGPWCACISEVATIETPTRVKPRINRGT